MPPLCSAPAPPKSLRGGVGWGGVGWGGVGWGGVGWGGVHTQHILHGVLCAGFRAGVEACMLLSSHKAGSANAQKLR